MGCSTSKPSTPGPALAPPPDARPAVPRIKLVLLGDSGVGKSCLVLRYVRGTFDPASKVTVGAAYVGHALTLADGRAAKLEIWDTAGQERYASLAPLYYRGAAAAIVVYSVADRESFARAAFWAAELARGAGGGGGGVGGGGGAQASAAAGAPAHPPVTVLVGNKADLADARAVTPEEGADLAASHGMLFAETSAKTATGVAAVFESAGAAVLDRRR